MQPSRRTRIVAACTASLLVVQAVWSISNPDAAEGPILIVFSRDHGLVAGDLLGMFLALLAFGLWFMVSLAPAAPADERPPVAPHAAPEAARRRLDYSLTTR